MTSNNSPQMVTLYTKKYCPYCNKAKDLLDSLDIQYTDIDVTHDQEKFKKAQKMSGIHTVPQIFANEKFLGGCDDIHALHQQGKLLDALKS